MGRFQTTTNVTRLECTKFSIQIIFPTTILGRYVAVNNHVCDTYERFVGFRVYLKFSVEFAVVSITIIYCFEILHLIGCSHTHIGRDVQSVSPFCSFYRYRQKNIQTRAERGDRIKRFIALDTARADKPLSISDRKFD